jgi:L-rhamnonate dehydratase
MAMCFNHVTLAEFMMMSEKADKIEPNFGTVFKNEPLPKDGYITLSDKPGFGLELNKEALNLHRPFDRSKEAADGGAGSAAPAAKRSRGR